MSTEPQSFDILLVPEHIENLRGESAADRALRVATVEATGETGASGYPATAGRAWRRTSTRARARSRPSSSTARNWTTGWSR